MATFPTLWRCNSCRMHIAVDPEKQSNVRWPQGFTEIYCTYCKTWGEPVHPNGWGR